MRLVLLQPQLRAWDDAVSLQRVDALLGGVRGELRTDDVILLPEHILFTNDRDEYLRRIRALASGAGCCVVGGSYHERRDGGAVNAGCAVLPDGSIAGTYEKLRPYAEERRHAVPGSLLGEFTLQGLHILVMICADFWFSDLFFRATRLPDLVLVPALSVTRKESPHYSRSLWRQLAVARAYEFGCFVGISDWAHSSELPRLIASGVGGFADPSGTDADGFFSPIDASGLGIFELPMDRLHAFRQDRRERGFFWKPESA